MSNKVYESGHARNVELFQQLVAAVESFGPSYDPPAASLASAALAALLLEGQTAIQSVAGATVPYKIAVNERESAYEPLSRLATRVLNSFIAAGAPANAVEDARGYVRKIRGERKSKLKLDDPNTPEDESLQNHSASQQSYSQRVENLDSLIALLQGYPVYDPNETELKITALLALSAALKGKNAAVSATRAELSVKRIDRNGVLYQEPAGLVPIALRVKTYVKSAFGSTSGQYKQISGLRFSKKKV